MQTLHLPISTKKINELHNKINDYTQKNLHNYAVLQLVDFLDEKGEFSEYKDELNNIIEEHDILGYMNTSSIERRDEIRQICLSIFRLYYGNNAVKKIYSAY
jgi:hypothetical protein